jgi:hypothetical protein
MMIKLASKAIQFASLQPVSSLLLLILYLQLPYRVAYSLSPNKEKAGCSKTVVSTLKIILCHITEYCNLHISKCSNLSVHLIISATIYFMINLEMSTANGQIPVPLRQNKINHIINSKLWLSKSIKQLLSQ